MAAVDLGFKEQAALLGKRSSLVSIITRPADARGGDEPAIVILNTGIVHRVGHHRMYVTLSRMLAASGHTVVRFDFSGIGDSAPRNDYTPPLAACLAEIKEVMDSVEVTYRISRFVLVGLCSGADHAVLYGGQDPRVVRLVLMDPTIPPTARYYFHYVMQRLHNPSNWLSVATGRSGLVRLVTAHLLHRVKPKGSGLQDLTLQNLQFSSYLTECYRAAAVRGVKILSVLTSVSARYTYRQQMLDTFPEASGGALRLEHFPESDHLFSTERERTRLLRIIAEWLESS
jgi:pimeloyl-ACP methyl ester carboxylesterase